MDPHNDAMDLDSPELGADGDDLETQSYLRVEFHFLVDLDKFPSSSQETGRLPQAQSAAELICSQFEEAGAGDTIVSWKVKEPGGGNKDEDEAEYEGWVVTIGSYGVGFSSDEEDLSLSTENTIDESCIGFTVMQPYLRRAEENSFTQIKYAAEALRSLHHRGVVRFNKDSTYCVIGGDEDGLPIVDLLRVYTLLWLGGEEILHGVHPKHRRGCWNALPCTAYSEFAMNLSKGKSVRKTCDCEPHATNRKLAWAKACRVGPDDEVDAPDDDGADAPGNIDVMGGSTLECDQNGHGFKHQIDCIWERDCYSSLLDLFPHRGAYWVYQTDGRVKDDQDEQGGPSKKWIRRDGYAIVFAEGECDLTREGDEDYPVIWARVVAGLVRWAMVTEEGEAAMKAQMKDFGDVIEKVFDAAKLGAGHEEEMVETLLKSVQLPDDVVTFIVDRAKRMEKPVLEEMLEEVLEDSDSS